MAFERLTPRQVCRAFSRGLNRPVHYRHGPIKIAVSVPSGYREQLEILEQVLGDHRAPYFGPDLEYPNEARSIWEGYRGIEEYAREAFPIEEYANGLRWMEESPEIGGGEGEDGESETNGDAMEGVVSIGGSRPITPAGRAMPAASALAFSNAYTPRSHPEGREGDFFIGSC